MVPFLQYTAMAQKRIDYTDILLWLTEPKHEKTNKKCINKISFILFEKEEKHHDYLNFNIILGLFSKWFDVTKIK